MAALVWFAHLVGWFLYHPFVKQTIFTSTGPIFNPDYWPALWMGVVNCLASISRFRPQTKLLVVDLDRGFGHRDKA